MLSDLRAQPLHISVLAWASVFAGPPLGFYVGQRGGRKYPSALLSPLQALKDLKGQTEAIPCVVGDEEVWTSDVQYQVSVSPVGWWGLVSP